MVKLTKEQKECRHEEWEHCVEEHKNMNEKDALWLFHRCKKCRLSCMPQLVVLLEGER